MSETDAPGRSTVSVTNTVGTRPSSANSNDLTEQELERRLADKRLQRVVTNVEYSHTNTVVASEAQGSGSDPRGGYRY